MKEPVFTGVCPAMITPFGADGAVNYDKFAELVERQIHGGVSAICVCGTTGESATLSDREHAELVDFCVARVDGRAKVLAGAGSNDTIHALELSLHAQESGADALLLVTPYYNKATQLGLEKHFTYIADRVDIPIVLYNVPSRTGVSISAPTYQTLARHPNINGVKEASGNLALVTQTLSRCPEDFFIWSGNDDQTVPLMALGAKGVVSVAANLIPEVMVRLTSLCLDGQFESATKLQIQYADFMDALFCEVNPIPVKTAMNIMGAQVGEPRLPLCEMSPTNADLLRKTLRAYGFLA